MGKDIKVNVLQSKDHKQLTYSNSKVTQVLIFSFVFISIGLGACGTEENNERFQKVSPDESGVLFSNNLEESPDFNILNYLYFYDGGGVSVGDINNDGLPDIYFTANMLPNRLYINKGGFKFDDITNKAGVAGQGDWTSGTTMADVNGDGLLDIYVTNVNYLSKKGRNELFINNGDSTFTEKASEYGLDFQGYSKQAVFFDYNNDGNLDLYLLNHAIHTESSYTRADQRDTFDALAGDRLFRNDGNKFIDVSQEAGIYSSPMGYGLAVTASDINMDGCIDLYVSNDFHENDYLYLNNCNGTFKEVLEKSMGHTSRASMGNDIADVNNDLLPDVMVLDMLPYEEEVLKSSSSTELYEVYDIQRRMGYHPQYTRNSLQYNLGQLNKGEIYFSEIAQYAGVHATDWSWAPLLFDMDNNGYKDLAVTNGIYRRPNDLDYLARISSDNVQQSLNRGITSENMSHIERMPHVKIPNFLFSNNGDLTFTHSNSRWGLTESTYSSGMAYGDLDNDGDLDLVINNVNEPAFIYRNRTREIGGGNYLKIELRGGNKNKTGIGSKIITWTKESSQLYEQILTRGFLSSVSPLITIGLDSVQTVDSLTVVWSDGQYQTLTGVKGNQTITLKQAEAGGQFSYENFLKQKNSLKIFTEITDELKIDYVHRENTFIDYNKQNLMPHLLSHEGPKITTGDINGDGLDDLYIGGAKYQRGKLLVQQHNGTFKETNRLVFKQDEAYEDTDAVFFDANSDGALDLYIVSGGNEYPVGSRDLEDRLYFNDGKGNFIRVYDALPQIFENGSTVTAEDYDGDGDVDLFVGSRSVPQQYGVNPRSYLLENAGNGRFREVTEPFAPGLSEVGMVTDALWEDINKDGQKDLVVVGEWMPVTVFVNKNGKLEKTSYPGLTETNGWWNRIKSIDFDDDGDSDFIVGNVGLNTFFQASREEPLVLYLKDFNNDGQTDPIIGYTKYGDEYPVASRDELMIPLKFLRESFPVYRDYAGSTIQEIFGEHLDRAQKKEIYMMSTSILENLGNGSFKVRTLPKQVQFAPVYGIEILDFDSDEKLDLMVAGNFHHVKPSYGGQYDASYGWVLKGNGSGGFKVISPSKSGFSVPGETRDLKLVSQLNGDNVVLVARNNDSLMVFKPTPEQ